MRKNRFLFLLLACALMLTLTGCGFKSDPSPSSSDDNFKWGSIKTTVKAPCITVSGDISCNVRNVDEILIEIQKAGEEADCPTCPFRSDEEFAFTPGELGLLSNSGKFDAQICPTQISSLYRMKVTAKSKYYGMPDAVSKEIFIEMP